MTDRMELAAKGRDNLYWLAKDVLGYDKMAPEPHQELCDFYSDSKKDIDLILMPRGTYKSSVITVAGSIQQMIRNPNVRILISSETQNKANKFVSEIKQHLEMNMKMRSLYGSWQKSGNIWKSNEFTISPRNRPKKEPTVMSGSLEKGTLTGYHYDYIVLDDVVSENNVNTTEQIEKTIDHFKLLLSILDPGGKIIVIGTRWSYYELYAWLLDADGPVSEDVGRLIMQAVDDTGEPTMPNILSAEFLEKTRKRQGSYIFAAQYLNNITSGDNNTFDIKDIQFYEEGDEPEGLVHFMTVDPAVSLKARSDYTGIIVNGVDYLGKWWIREAYNIKLEPSELVALLLELSRKYDPLMVCAMEKFALEKMLKYSLFAKMEDENHFFPIKDLETSTRISKEARIRSLQPITEAKKIHIKKEHKELYKQINEHPFGRHDDVLDALKSQVSIVFPSDVKPKKQIKGPQLTHNEKELWKEVDQLSRPRRVRSNYDW
jgi:hypothetical protein